MVDLLEWLVKERSVPRAIRVDNGPEFTSVTFMDWCHKRRIEIWYIQPGKPSQNGYIERFNKTYRGEVLDVRRFENLIQVKEHTYEFIEDYNYNRPHDSLGKISPIDYLLKENNSSTQNLTKELFPSNRLSNDKKSIFE